MTTSVLSFHSQRKDIRRAAMVALANGGVPPFATMAQDRVFDSRADALIAFQDGGDLPAVTVYTDGHKRRPIAGGSKKAAPFENSMFIVLELTVSSGQQVETDAELEAKLDDLEEECLAALFDPTKPLAAAFMLMIRKVDSVESMRLGSSESATRLALRDLAIEVEFDQGCKTLEQAMPQFTHLFMSVPPDQVIQAQDIMA